LKGKKQKKLQEENKLKKEDDSDKRNLYLGKEGAIYPDSEAAKSLSKTELAKRLKAEQEKKRKLKNSNYFVSKTRLSIRNLPPTVDEKGLKELVINAIKKRLSNPASQESNLEGAKQKIIIKQVKIQRSTDRLDTNGKPRSKGFGFVEFVHHPHALAALRQINNNPEYFGENRRPIVEFALENANILKLRVQKLQKSSAKSKLGISSEKQAEERGKDKNKEKTRGSEPRGNKRKRGETNVSHDAKRVKTEKSLKKKPQKATAPSGHQKKKGKDQRNRQKM